MNSSASRLFALALGTALGGGLAGVPAAAQSTAEPVDTSWQGDESALAWGSCPDGRHDDMQCASLEVPVDWSAPEGGTVSLNLARIPATGPSSGLIGSVVMLAGGPGASGIDNLQASAEALGPLRSHFHLVAHEPRTAYAWGALPGSCQQSGWLALPHNEHEYDELIAGLAGAVEQCRNDDPSGLVDHLDGISQARDVEAIRRALGEQSLSLMGVSYAGVPVLAYARLFPDRLRAAYLDGVLSHPDLAEGQDALAQTLEDAFRKFAHWCETTSDCVLHGEDVAGVWRDLAGRVDRSPLQVESERFGEGEIVGAHLHLARTGPEEADRHRFADAIDRARQGDGSGFADHVLGHISLWTRPIWIAMQCSDGLLGPSGYDAFARSLERAKQARPNVYGNRMLGLICGAWPLPVANPPAPMPDTDVGPFLGSGTRDDLDSTEQLMAHIPGSVTVRVEGPGHAVSIPMPGYPANQCVIEHATRYLTELKLPPPGTTCDPEEGGE